jgi:hypothetical protein
MYRGFNLDLSIKDIETHYDRGLSLFAENRRQVKETLNQYLLSDGSLDGVKMQSNWFGQIDAHIFISHSHKDERTAILLSGVLFNLFGIRTFIDSCIWGYSNDLLKLIDDRYCLNPSGETYSYEKRNYSTSHVHIMLSTALSMMIDKTECIFFLNTPNSITTQGIISQTESPWIYSEIALTQLVHHKIPRRRMVNEMRAFSKAEGIDEALRIKYDLNLSHLADLSSDNIKKWITQSYSSPHEALDGLYNIVPIKNSSIIGG